MVVRVEEEDEGDEEEEEEEEIIYKDRVKRRWIDRAWLSRRRRRFKGAEI